MSQEEYQKLQSEFKQKTEAFIEKMEDGLGGYLPDEIGYVKDDFSKLNNAYKNASNNSDYSDLIAHIKQSLEVINSGARQLDDAVYKMNDIEEDKDTKGTSLQNKTSLIKTYIRDEQPLLQQIIGGNAFSMKELDSLINVPQETKKLSPSENVGEVGHHKNSMPPEQIADSFHVE